MGFDIFLPYTAKIESDTEITDFTYRGEEIVAEFDFKLDGDTLYYHRLVHARNLEDNITLQRTDEDPVEVYNEFLQKSAEAVSQNPTTTDIPDEVDEQIPETTTQPNEDVPADEEMPEDNTAPEAGTFTFVGVTYKNEDRDLTFQLKTPDANGYPTEITLNGATYTEVIFNNDTFALSNVSIIEDGGYTVKATWYIGEQEYALNIFGNDESWRMYGPSMCSGDYYPE